jgi:type IV secretion system protein VirB1
MMIRHIARLLACTAQLWSACAEALPPNMEALLQACAPTVHPATMARIVYVESRGRPFAIADGGPTGLPWSIRQHLVKSHFPETKAEAEALANRLIDAGHVIGVGLAQVSSRNLASRGLTVADALEPCLNLRAGGEILTEFYAAALARHPGDPQRALIAAISAYNTGDFIAGVLNGYVRQVLTVEAIALRGPVPEQQSNQAERAALREQRRDARRQ